MTLRHPCTLRLRVEQRQELAGRHQNALVVAQQLDVMLSGAEIKLLNRFCGSRLLMNTGNHTASCCAGGQRR